MRIKENSKMACRKEKWRPNFIENEILVTKKKKLRIKEKVEELGLFEKLNLKKYLHKRDMGQ